MLKQRSKMMAMDSWHKKGVKDNGTLLPVNVSEKMVEDIDEVAPNLSL